MQVYNNIQLDDKISIKDFVSIKTLGTGSYGKVMLVKYKKTQQLFAMKMFKKDLLRQKKQVQNTIQELKILESIDNPFIVKLKYAFTSKDRVYIVMNYCSGGELFFYLQKLNKLKENAIKFYASNIIIALRELHQNNIIHRDIKPENVMIDDQGFAVLVDFGLSKTVQCESDKISNICGTIHYMDPVVIKTGQCGQTVDWWQFGVLLYEMATGYTPFFSTDNAKIIQNILNNEPNLDIIQSDILRDLIFNLLKKDPINRLTDINKIMNHQFFNDINWTEMYNRTTKPPYVPIIQNPTDTSHFDKEQTNIHISPLTQDNGFNPCSPNDEFCDFYCRMSFNDKQTKLSTISDQSILQ